MKTDSLLWKKLKEGNKQALQAIYESEVQYLFNYCLRLTNNDHIIEDAIQELFVELWNRRSTIGMTDQIRPYLTTSIRRKVVSLLQSQAKISGDVNETLAFRTDAAIDEQIIAGEGREETNLKLKEAMVQLSNRQREAIYLKFYQEMSYEDICEAMGLNYQSARNLVSSGLKKMKQLLGSDLFFWWLLSTNYTSIPYLLNGWS